MLSIKGSFNVPALVLGVCIVGALGLNVVSYKREAQLAQIAAAKQETVTRLLVDR